MLEDFMAGMIEKKLASLGISLPTPASPIANYVPFVRSGNLLVVSGQLCFGADGKLVAKGQLGGSVSIEDGQQAARACAVNLLAQIKGALPAARPRSIRRRPTGPWRPVCPRRQSRAGRRRRAGCRCARTVSYTHLRA